MWMSVCLCGHMCIWVKVPSEAKRVQSSLQLKLKVVVSYLLQVQGTELGPSVRAVSPVSCWAILSATTPLFYFCVCMSNCLSRMYVHHMFAWFAQRSKESCKPPGTEATDGREPSRTCWESNLSSNNKQEQQMTLTTEWSHQLLQPPPTLLSSKILRRYHCNTTTNSSYLVLWLIRCKVRGAIFWGKYLIPWSKILDVIVTTRKAEQNSQLCEWVSVKKKEYGSLGTGMKKYELILLSILCIHPCYYDNCLRQSHLWRIFILTFCRQDSPRSRYQQHHCLKRNVLCVQDNALCCSSGVIKACLHNRKTMEEWGNVCWNFKPFL